MASVDKPSFTIAWGDGTSDYLTCSHSTSSGNQMVTISSSLNKGATSRTKTLEVITSSGESATMTITQKRDGIGSMIIGSTFVIPNETSSASAVNLSLDENEGTVANENLGIASEMNIEESKEELEEETNTTTKSSNGFFNILKRLFS